MMTNDFLRLEQAWEYAEQNETILVRSAQSGKLEAFNALVLKYQDLMYGMALRILGQDALAEDATQEAFISAYQHIVNFRGGPLKAWLVRILINKCYDEFRYMQRTPAIFLNESLTDDGENESLYIRFQNHVPSVEECVEAFERNEYQYFTKVNKCPKNPRKQGCGRTPAPLFSGLYKLFRDLLSISKNAWANCRPITASSLPLWISRRCLMARRPPS